MHDEQNSHNPALTELRRRLAGGLARARLDQKQLATQAALGRTTVSEALSPNGPVPSAATVAALARVLKLPVPELLELRRTAAEESGAAPTGGPGRPVGECEPHDLEVHPAGPGRTNPGSGSPTVRVLPGYVARAHDRVLAQAVQDAAVGRSGMVVLVGTSSTGKTRACWEAVQPLAGKGWRLWHPFDPTRAEAALEDLHRVGPRTVVWLNEAQHYLGDRAAGERIAAAVHHLLVSPERGPALVLGTLWPKYATQYARLPAPGAPDPHSQARELLAGRTLSVPEDFDSQALAEAAALAEAGDRLLGDALTRTRTNGRLAQDLAGAPELLNRYEHGSPAARALLEAAMDARRLGAGLYLPQAFLTDAAPGYLTDTDYDQFADDGAEQVEQAYTELAELVHGKQAPLRRTAPRPPTHPSTPTTVVRDVVPQTAEPHLRLADYLEQHGRTIRRHRCPPTSFWHAAHTHLTDPDDLDNLTEAAVDRHRLLWAHRLRQRAADHGSDLALWRLAVLRLDVRDEEGAEALFRRAADLGDTNSLSSLALMREEAGDLEGAEALFRRAADLGDTDGLVSLSQVRERDGDLEGAEALLRQAAAHGNIDVLGTLARMRQKVGDLEGAEALLQQATDLGAVGAFHQLAVMRMEAGDQEGAEGVLRRAADRGIDSARYRLMNMREEAGDREGAEALALQAADLGNGMSLVRLAEWREGDGDREGAEALLRQAVDHGEGGAFGRLAEWRERDGDQEGAETLLRQAADHGAAYRLASGPEAFKRVWPHGLDPEGAPTPPWQP